MEKFTSCAVIRTDSLVKTCSRFKSIVEKTGTKILPRIHFKFPEKVLQKLLRRSNKIKISAQNQLKCFGLSSGVVESVNLIIRRKNSRSSWMLIEEAIYNWFMIEQIFLKFSKQNQYFSQQAGNIHCVNVSVFGVILVSIFRVFSRIRTEYGEIRSISPYSVQMRKTAGKMRTRITLNKSSFYASLLILRKSYGCIMDYTVSRTKANKYCSVNRKQVRYVKYK